LNRVKDDVILIVRINMLEAASFDEMDVGHNRLDVVIKGESKQEFGAISTGPSLLAASTGTR